MPSHSKATIDSIDFVALDARFAEVPETFHWSDNNKALLSAYRQNPDAKIVFDTPSKFVAAYKKAVTASKYQTETTAILPALLQFIDDSVQANKPQQVVTLLNKLPSPKQQKTNQQLFSVLEDFEYLIYLDWLITRNNYASVLPPLMAWMAKYPELVITKMVLHIDALMLYRDNAKAHQVQASREILIKLLDVFYSSDPERFEQFHTAYAIQNVRLYSRILKSRIAATIQKTSTIDDLTPTHLAQVSKWITIPPWQDKQYCLRAPKLGKKLPLADRPKLFFKDMTSDITHDTANNNDNKKDANAIDLPATLLDNLIGILYKSTLNDFITPLTAADMRQLLTPFTTESLNALGWYLWRHDVETPLAWLMNEHSAPPIHTFIQSNKKGGDAKSSRLLLKLLGVAIEFWFADDISIHAGQMQVSPRISRLLDTLLYQLDHSKPRFKSYVKRALKGVQQTTEMSLTQLRDLALPTLDFSATGERVFSLHPAMDKTAPTKQITVRLDNYHQLHLFGQFGEDSQPLARFPRAKKGDDTARFKQVNKDIKALQKQLDNIHNQLNERLAQELQTSDQRPASFMFSYGRCQPLLRPYLKTLIWSVIHPQTFTVEASVIMDEDGQFINSQFMPYSDAQIAKWQDDNNYDYAMILTHPAHLTPTQQQDWTQLLADYTIVSPIEQLSLPVERLTQDEQNAGVMHRYDGVYFRAAELLTALFNQYSQNQYEDIDALLSQARFGDIDLHFTQPIYQLLTIDPHNNWTEKESLLTHYPLQLKPIALKNKNPKQISDLLIMLEGLTPLTPSPEEVTRLQDKMAKEVADVVQWREANNDA